MTDCTQTFQDDDGQDGAMSESSDMVSASAMNAREGLVQS